MKLNLLFVTIFGFLFTSSAKAEVRLMLSSLDLPSFKCEVSSITYGEYFATIRLNAKDLETAVSMAQVEAGFQKSLSQATSGTGGNKIDLSQFEVVCSESKH